MITRTTESALKILINLAKIEPGKIVSLNELHSYVGGSVTYLAKITASLAKTGIVRSSRGAQGGLSMIKRPSEISLLEVVTAIQGAPAKDFCQTDEAKGIEYCGYHKAMEDLYASIVETLGRHTIAQMMEAPCGRAPSGRLLSNCRMLIKGRQ